MQARNAGDQMAKARTTRPAERPERRAAASAGRGWQRRYFPAVQRVVRRWYARRPFTTTWGSLAGAMVILIIAFGWDAGLTLRQHGTLAVLTVGLAWVCTWIIFLEDAVADDEGRD